MTAFVSDDPGQAWNNPPKGKEIAISQYDQGADIIYHAAGGTGMGVFEAALEKNKWAIGVDSDQGLILATSDQEKDREMAKHIITSMLKRVDTAVYTIIKEMYDNGKVDAKVMEFGLKENGVGYAYNDYNKDLLDPIKPQVDELKQKIINGEIKVPATDDELQQFKASLGQ
jgi:basic membrane protein A